MPENIVAGLSTSLRLSVSCAVPLTESVLFAPMGKIPSVLLRRKRESLVPVYARCPEEAATEEIGQEMVTEIGQRREKKRVARRRQSHFDGGKSGGLECL